MEKRVLIAILLCFLSLYLWQALVVKPVPKPASTTAKTPAAVTPEESKGPTSAQPSAEANEVSPPPVATLIGETAEREVKVETQDVIAVFTNKGARLKSWRLKHYLDARQQPQELIESTVASHPLPFTLRT